ncbi:MAG: hypothetical protein ABGX12_04965, partial [Desulfurobacteriaceae bacterium]
KKLKILPTDIGYTKSRYIKNLTPLHLFKNDNNFKNLLTQSIDIIARLHQIGLIHGDLALSNFGVADDIVYLLDLETVRRIYLRALAHKEIVNFIDDLIKELIDCKAQNEILDIVDFVFKNYVFKTKISGLYLKYLNRLLKRKLTERLWK